MTSSKQTGGGDDHMKQPGGSANDPQRAHESGKKGGPATERSHRQAEQSSPGRPQTGGSSHESDRSGKSHDSDMEEDKGSRPTR